MEMEGLRAANRVSDSVGPRMRVRSARALPGNVVVAVLLLALQGVKAQADESDVLERWLAQLRLQLDDATVTVAGGKASTTNVICSNFSLSHASSSPAPSNDSAFTLGVEGATMRCDGSWQYQRSSFPRADSSGSLEAVVSDGALQLGLALHGHDPLADRFKVPDPPGCSAHIAIDTLRLHGNALGTLADVVAHVLTPLIRARVERSMCDQLTQLVETNLTRTLQSANRPLRDLLATPPSTLPTGRLQGSVDLRRNPIVDSARAFFEGAFAPSLLNDLLRDFVLDERRSSSHENKEYSLHVETHMRSKTNAGDTAELELRLDNGVTLYGLDGLKELSGPIALYPNLVSIEGQLSHVYVSLPAQISVVPLSGSIEGDALVEDCVVHANLSSVTLRVSSFLAVNGSALSTLKGDELSQPQCRASAVQLLNVSGADANVSISELSIAPLTAHNDHLEQDLDEAIRVFSRVLLSDYAGTVKEVVRSAVQSSSSLDQMTEVVQLWLRNQRRGHCKPSVQRIFSRFTNVSNVSLQLSLALLASACITVLAWNVYTRHKSRSMDSQLLAVDECQASEPLLATIENGEMQHTRLGATLPIALEFAFVFCLFANALLFLSSNLSIAATVRLRIHNSADGARGESITVPSVFDFSLLSTVAEMWVAGVYPLAILIAAFSGLWPYLKLMALGLCVALPTSLLTERRRHSILSATDVLGKWSFIDGSVLVLFIVAFHMRFVRTDEANGAFITGVLFVQPHTGCYTCAAKYQVKYHKKMYC